MSWIRREQPIAAADVENRGPLRDQVRQQVTQAADPAMVDVAIVYGVDQSHRSPCCRALDGRVIGGDLR